jgi:hypothetical protein
MEEITEFRGQNVLIGYQAGIALATNQNIAIGYQAEFTVADIFMGTTGIIENSNGILANYYRNQHKMEPVNWLREGF